MVEHIAGHMGVKPGQYPCTCKMPCVPCTPSSKARMWLKAQAMLQVHSLQHGGQILDIQAYWTVAYASAGFAGEHKQSAGAMSAILWPSPYPPHPCSIQLSCLLSKYVIGLLFDREFKCVIVQSMKGGSHIFDMLLLVKLS